MVIQRLSAPAHSHSMGKVPDLAALPLLWSVPTVLAVEFSSLSGVSLTRSQATALCPSPFRNSPWSAHGHSVGLAGKTGSTRRITGPGGAGQGAEPAEPAEPAEASSLSCRPCWGESPHTTDSSAKGRAGTSGPGEGFSMLCSLPVKPLLLPFLPYPKHQASLLLALLPTSA